MPKLIDADKLKEHYAWWDNEDKKIFDTIVDLQPEAVVRCKDCKYFLWWVSNGKEEFDCIRFLDAPPITPDFYCAWGERTEDGNKPKSI